MRAYFAILKDSFREAIASRVLLIALAGIVVVLLLLAPFGLSTDKSTSLKATRFHSVMPTQPACRLWIIG